MALVKYRRYIVPAGHPRQLAERDARPIEGLMTGAGLGLVFWAAVGLVANLS